MWSSWDMCLFSGKLRYFRIVKLSLRLWRRPSDMACFSGPSPEHLFPSTRSSVLWEDIEGIFYIIIWDLKAFSGETKHNKQTWSEVNSFMSYLVLLRTAKWRAFLAGALAGPSMLLTGLNTQHKSLAIYILMRAAVLASRCGIKSKRFGRICKPLTWKHGDIFLMCLSSSQIL